MAMRQIGLSAPPATITSASPPATSHPTGPARRRGRRGIADGVRAGRAGRDDCMVGALEAVPDRDVAGGEVDEPPRNEERTHPAPPPVPQDPRGIGDAA